jgi:ATP-dependent helicase/nuclease subunit B
MQLPIYMLAVRNASRSRVKDIAGAFYMPVEAKVRASALTELPQAGARFSRKAKGIFNGEFARQLDAGASKDSKFYNFFVTKENEPYGNYGGRDVLRRDDFENVLRFAGKKVVRIAEEIVSGKIDVWPYRIDRRSPCNYCKYKAVCRFDWQINDYNALESINKPQALEEMRGVNA